MSVTHVVAEEPCEACKGAGRIPKHPRGYVQWDASTGRHVDNGEVIACPICSGLGRTRVSISLATLRRLLWEMKGCPACDGEGRPDGCPNCGADPAQSYAAKKGKEKRHGR